MCPTELVSENWKFSAALNTMQPFHFRLSSNQRIQICLLTSAGSLLSPAGNIKSYPRLKLVKEESSAGQVEVMISGDIHLCFLRYPSLDDLFYPLQCIIFRASFFNCSFLDHRWHFSSGTKWLACHRII